MNYSTPTRLPEHIDLFMPRRIAIIWGRSMTSTGNSHTLPIIQVGAHYTAHSTQLWVHNYDDPKMPWRPLKVTESGQN